MGMFNLNQNIYAKKDACKGRNTINQALDDQIADSYRQYDIKKLNNESCQTKA